MFAQIAQQWREMSTARKIRRVVMLALIAVGIWALSPYLYSRSVDEDFPVTQSQAVPAAQGDVMAKPEEGAMAEGDAMAKPEEGAMAEGDAMAKPEEGAMAEGDAMAKPEEGAMAEGDAIAEPAATAVPVPSEPVALSVGSFTRVDAVHAAEGSATVYQLPDGKLVLRLENFKSTNGPDLFIGLSGHAMPRSSAEVHDQGYIELAALKANEGNQNYELPADLDLSGFKSVVIYCRAFSVVFSTAELQGM